MGFEDVKALKGGWDVWKLNDHPTVPTGPGDK
jgi:3-mercaptopyruvate sulfurtransferase SseA